MFSDDEVEPVTDYGALLRRASDMIVREAVAELDLPHLVICRDPITNIVTHSGPYANAMAAACVAEWESAADAGEPVESRLIYSVAPLLTPLDVPT